MGPVGDLDVPLVVRVVAVDLDVVEVDVIELVNVELVAEVVNSALMDNLLTCMSMLLLRSQTTGPES